MKIGFNMLLWTGLVDEEHFPLLQKIKAAGYDGVELPLFAGDTAHYRKVKKAIDDNGLECTAVTVIPDVEHSPISPEESHRAGAVEHLKWAVDCAAAAGAQVLMGPYYQPLGVFTGDGPTEDEKRWGAEVHRQIAEDAQEAGVLCAVEFLNRFECYFLTTMADAVAYVKRVDHPNFKTMFDTFHANIEEKDPVAAIKHGGEHIGHVHISENDRGTPGFGHIDFAAQIKAIKEIGYDGWMTIEAFGRALPDLASGAISSPAPTTSTPRASRSSATTGRRNGSVVLRGARRFGLLLAALLALAGLVAPAAVGEHLIEQRVVEHLHRPLTDTVALVIPDQLGMEPDMLDVELAGLIGIAEVALQPLELGGFEFVVDQSPGQLTDFFAGGVGEDHRGGSEVGEVTPF